LPLFFRRFIERGRGKILRLIFVKGLLRPEFWILIDLQRTVEINTWF